MAKASIEVRHIREFPGVELHHGTSVIRSVAPHWHSEFQICLITGGGGDLLYKGLRHHTPAGTMFAIHPGETHANETSWAAGCSFRTLNIDSHVIAALSPLIEPSGRVSYRVDAYVDDQELIRRFLQSYDVITGACSRLEMESSLMASLNALITRYASQVPGTAELPRGPKSVRTAREYLADNYDQNVSLRELAGLAGLSPFHLARTFTSQIGMPPHRFQTQVRLEHAKRFLRKGWPVARVASECGFADQSHLIRRFKRLVGVTPDQYRGF